MLKNLFLIACFFLSHKCHSQKDDGESIINVQPHICFPVGDVKTTNGIELGGHISLERSIAEHARLIIQYGGGLLPGKKYFDSSLA